MIFLLKLVVMFKITRSEMSAHVLTKMKSSLRDRPVVDWDRFSRNQFKSVFKFVLIIKGLRTMVDCISAYLREQGKALVVEPDSPAEPSTSTAEPTATVIITLSPFLHL